MVLVRYTNNSAKFEPSTVNGILTGTAIVFGFVSFEIREIKGRLANKLGVAVPPIFFLYATILLYFGDALEGGVSVLTVYVATASFLFNIAYFPLVLALRKIAEKNPDLDILGIHK
jgi:hypothetical protein